MTPFPVIPFLPLASDIGATGLDCIAVVFCAAIRTFDTLIPRSWEDAIAFAFRDDELGPNAPSPAMAPARDKVGATTGTWTSIRSAWAICADSLMSSAMRDANGPGRADG